jgi:hypothetical protein
LHGARARAVRRKRHSGWHTISPVVGPSEFHIDAPEGDRWQLALELLTTPDGEETVVYRGIGLWNGRERGGRQNDAAFTAAVLSTWDLDQATEATARQDLERARGTLTELRENSREFDAMVAGRSIEYVLIYDYGMGGVHLAVLGPQGFRPLRPLRPS